MQVDLIGKTVALAGFADGIGAKLREMLTASGARLRIAEIVDQAAGDEWAVGSTPDILIVDAISAAVEPRAILALMRRSADAMAERGSGRIVILASALGLVAARDEAERGAKAAAIFSATRALALEHGPAGVVVNAVACGAVEGAMEERLSERLLTHTPVRRPAKPEEVVAAVLFLIDPDNAYTTGHVLAVDGGWTAGYARNF